MLCHFKVFFLGVSIFVSPFFFVILVILTIYLNMLAHFVQPGFDTHQNMLSKAGELSGWEEDKSQVSFIMKVVLCRPIFHCHYTL